MAPRTEGILAKMRREERNKGKKNIINELLKTYTLQEVSSMINKEVSEIQKIISID